MLLQYLLLVPLSNQHLLKRIINHNISHLHLFFLMKELNFTIYFQLSKSYVQLLPNPLPSILLCYHIQKPLHDFKFYSLVNL